MEATAAAWIQIALQALTVALIYSFGKKVGQFEEFREWVKTENESVKESIKEVRDMLIKSLGRRVS